MRSAIPNSQKQNKSKKTQPKNYNQNTLHSCYQHIIKVGNLSAKVSSRSPTKKPLSLILQSKPSRNTKPSLYKSNTHTRLYSNQYNSNLDASHVVSCQYADSSSFMTDENVNPNPDVINTLRISSLQKPSKFIIEPEGRSELLTNNSKARHQNLINEASNRLSNYSLVQISEEQQYKCLPLTLEGRNQDSYREVQQARVKQKQNQNQSTKQMSNIQWHEESNALQNQHNAPKICIEVIY